MVNQKIKPMAEGGILSAIAVIMALTSIYVPIIGTVVAFIWPLPIIVLVVRHGIRWGIMASVVSSLLIAMLIHPMQALMMFIGFGLVGIVLGYNYRRGFGAFKSLFIGMLSSIVAKAAVIGLSMLLMNINPFATQLEVMDEAFKSSINIYRAAGMAEGELVKLEAELTQALELVRLLFPLVLIFAGMLDAYINFTVAGKVLRKLGNETAELTAFKDWRMPLWVVYLYAFSLIGMYWGSTRELELLFRVSLNANIFGTVLGFLQGMTLMASAADRYKLATVWRVILLILFLTNGFFLQVIGFVGLFDIVFNYRRRLGWTE